MLTLSLTLTAPILDKCKLSPRLRNDYYIISFEIIVTASEKETVHYIHLIENRTEKTKNKITTAKVMGC